MALKTPMPFRAEEIQIWIQLQLCSLVPTHHFRRMLPSPVMRNEGCSVETVCTCLLLLGMGQHEAVGLVNLEMPGKWV